jgi:hypothetical protein
MAIQNGTKVKEGGYAKFGVFKINTTTVQYISHRLYEYEYNSARKGCKADILVPFRAPL